MAIAVRAGWLTALAVAVVAAVNGAGLWGIAVARRAAREEAARAFQAEVSARALRLEGRLSSTRLDLAFLAASAPVARLEAGLSARNAAEAAFRRQAAESALLLFLRSHPEVVRIVVRSERGDPLVQTGRRGGVPVLWVSSGPTGQEGAAVDPRRPRLTAILPFSTSSGDVGEEGRLETEIAPATLLATPESQDGASACELLDARGEGLAGPPLEGRPPPAIPRPNSRATVQAEGWSRPSPWTLECEQAAAPAAGLDDPVAARYRTTLVLNLAAMALTVLLAGAALREARRRAHLEARGREEAHVRELERQLFHSERLATVGRLAAGIAHEINNPLEGMANYLSLARDELGRGAVESARGRLDSVREGLDRAAAIVRQVLAHADPAKAPKELLDLNTVLLEAGEFVRSRREFGRIAFALDQAPEPLLVRGSAVMLGQVALNLVLNACEAQPRGGEVVMRSRREAAHAILEIADRGPGVAEADQARIFEPFYSTKDSTGLGLSICHSIAREHEGDLTVMPREGGGAVFILRIPEAPAGSGATPGRSALGGA